MERKDLNFYQYSTFAQKLNKNGLAMNATVLPTEKGTTTSKIVGRKIHVHRISGVGYFKMFDSEDVSFATIDAKSSYRFYIIKDKFPLEDLAAIDTDVLMLPGSSEGKSDPATAVNLTFNPFYKDRFEVLWQSAGDWSGSITVNPNELVDTYISIGKEMLFELDVKVNFTTMYKQEFPSGDSMLPTSNNVFFFGVSTGGNFFLDMNFIVHYSDF